MNEVSAYNDQQDEEWMGEMLQEIMEGDGGGGGGGGGEEEVAGYSKKRMRHINNERQRRILMNTLLDSLQTLLPDPHPRKDRCALLTDVIAHIQSLEEEVQGLAARTIDMKKAKPKVALSSINNMILSNKLVNTSLRNVHVQTIGKPFPENSISTINALLNQTKEIVLTFVSSPVRGLLPHILALLQMRQIEVFNATMCTTSDMQMLYCIHAHVPEDCSFQSDDLKVLLSERKFNKEDVS